MVRSKRVTEAHWADKKEQWARQLELADNPEFRKEYRIATGLVGVGAIMFAYSSSIATLTMFVNAAPDIFRDGAMEQNLILAGFIGIAAMAVVAVGAWNFKKFDAKWGL